MAYERDLRLAALDQAKAITRIADLLEWFKAHAIYMHGDLPVGPDEAEVIPSSEPTPAEASSGEPEGSEDDFDGKE